MLSEIFGVGFRVKPAPRKDINRLPISPAEGLQSRRALGGLPLPGQQHHTPMRGIELPIGPAGLVRCLRVLHVNYPREKYSNPCHFLHTKLCHEKFSPLEASPGLLAKCVYVSLRACVERLLAVAKTNFLPPVAA